MKTMRLSWIWVLAAFLVSCALDPPRPVGEEPDAGTPEAAADMIAPESERVEWPEDVLWDACEREEDCQGAQGAACVRVLGAGTTGVCTIVGCGPDDCPEGSTCRELAGDSVCLPGEDDFCSTECGEPLVCALSIECLRQGCCGSGPCPSVCAELSFSDCQMNALCSVDCCTFER